ncbi:glycerol-3-phosphate O-acyltransferase [Daedalea quercina L-15889]|uniref:Glycerol-3-phosphate O-acyltransferase n=1 Tax=Daedalea quercina L-15889 TaxID=1314783 RepID=A0A165PPX0_9APHY|nr:glycerol-3-phosphate O-acyltransferase [Daedalea quercina L-15889]
MRHHKTNELESLKPDTLYAFAMFFFRMVVNVFFRELHPRGTSHIPQHGPVIFVAAPHGNQSVDMVLALEVWSKVRRKVQFLVAAESMKVGLLGLCTRVLSSIPVVRAAEEAKPGTGYITLSEDNPCIVIGHGTEFTKEFRPRMQIMLPNPVGAPLAEVFEVVSDTELKLKAEFAGHDGKSTLKIHQNLEELRSQGLPGLEFKIAPYIDQNGLYQHVHQLLAEGGCISIFPEGKSHDRTDLLPLRAGVSAMALGAVANNPGLKLKIVPVGLFFFHPHLFRSRGVVEFGPAFDVPEDLVSLYRLGGAQKRQAIGLFLSRIHEALKPVTVSAPDRGTLTMCQAARRLYELPGRPRSLGQIVELNRRLLEGYSHFKDEPQVKGLRNDLLRYNYTARKLGLRDHQIRRAKRVRWKTIALLVYRLGLLIFWSMLALPGVVLNSPILVAASLISRKRAKEALIGSTVKIAAKDVIATWKILVSLMVGPIVYGLYALLVTLIVFGRGFSLMWLLYGPIIVLLALSLLTYAALKSGEASVDIVKSLSPLIVTLVPGKSRSLDSLKALRMQLVERLEDVVNDFGPKINENFNECRSMRAGALQASRP